ncbi:hypothetical protein [Corynebacterium variabile]|uniref:hypothetical protein n=1 Tax=Corynebacterium variabile TaxID=1727 RepID=UPI0028A6A1EB|nr:hypothetical protein [Corynebacterium variabile]
MAQIMDINPGDVVQHINELDTAYEHLQKAMSRYANAYNDHHCSLILNGDVRPLAAIGERLQARFSQTDTAVSDKLKALHQLRQDILTSAADSCGVLDGIEIPA